MKYTPYILPLILLVSLLSCRQKTATTTAAPPPQWTKKASIEMNSTFAKEENEEIEDFLKHRPDWKMTATETGLRYFVYEKSEKRDTVRAGDTVTVEFTIRLLDGTVCYTSDERGTEGFVVEKADIESGLHEGMQHLCTGDKALFILPSHLAHGLIGDTQKIPPLSPVIYDIHLIKTAHGRH